MMFLKSIIAGMFIGLGATAFLLSGNPFIFTIGIFLVFNFTGHLITGYVPLEMYRERFNIKNTIIVSIGNLIGAYVFGLIISQTRIINTIKPIVDKMILNKMNDSLISIFILSILCVALIGYGMIGTTKVHTYISRILILLFPTYIFVVCGLEHMVANAFYIAISLKFNILTTLPFLLTSVAGNIFGGLLVGYIQNKIDKN